jgi:hypothetical protein
LAKRVLDTARAADPDEIYQLLVEAHHDLDAEQSRQVGARLALLLANHIGDPAVIAAAVAAARAGVGTAEGEAAGPG